LAYIQNIGFNVWTATYMMTI